MKFVFLSALVLLLVLAGCVSNPPAGQPTTDVVNPPVVGLGPFVPAPGDPLTVCTGEDLEENHECFEHAFESCQRAVGVFWATSDGAPLNFESQGLNAEGKCRVRVTISSEASSAFAGQSATCAIPQTAAMAADGGLTTDGSLVFDVYSIGPQYCSGSFIDSIERTADPAPVQASPDTTPSVHELTITVGESGVQGEKEYRVTKGETVRLTIMVDTQDVSFNGEQILAPAQKGLPADQYIFDTAQILPGKSKTVEFIATETFEFGVYWPGPSVLKGKGKIVVDEN